jgi:hypothetical protein
MAKTGVNGQLTDQPIDPPREGNLFEPVDEPYGAHGDFDERAHGRSAVVWLSKHRGSVAAVVGGAALAGAAALLR